MSVTADAASKRAEARSLFEDEAWSLRDIGAKVGVSRETVRRWAAAEKWTAPLVAPGADGRPKPVPSTEELEAARLRAEKARQDARTRWAVRRGEEADAAGLTAGLVRGKLVEMLNAGKATEARQLATVYGIMIDKAILMSGETPGRSRPAGEMDGPPEARPTDPAAIAAAGAQRALTLLRPTIDAVSRARDASA